MRWYLAAAVLVLEGGCMTQPSTPEQTIPSKAEVIRIADRAVRALRIDVTRLKSFIDDDNSIWQRYPVPPEYAAVAAKLKGRVYWAVYYRPEPTRFGGEIFVFVDRITGEVIDTMVFQ